ncbi:MAG: TraR/DksA C4-type zinc finger protein [Deltaproteobacteria bacterium]|nr:TraR/DksA C4-type zinc finger protein [Deltaproteobacteria bacterium]
MKSTKISPEVIEETIQFHGHSCPGLAIGIRVAEVALEEFERSPDEEIVAVVETDMCAVDAVQYLTGCTFGKGNLIHLDYGKNAFTFYRRSDEKGIRVVTRPRAFEESDGGMLELMTKKIKEGGLTPEEEARLSSLRAARIKRIIEADPHELFEIKEVEGPIPKKARILESLACEACGERTMESRTRRFRGRTLCIPCFEAEEKRV